MFTVVLGVFHYHCFNKNTKLPRQNFGITRKVKAVSFVKNS